MACTSKNHNIHIAKSLMFKELPGMW